MKHATKEAERVQFLIDRDGYDSALQWVKRTYAIYKKALASHKTAFARQEPHRDSYIEICIYFKRFLDRDRDTSQ